MGQRMTNDEIASAVQAATVNIQKARGTTHKFVYGEHFAARGEFDFVVVGRFGSEVVAVYVVNGQFDGFDAINLTP